MNKKVSKKKVSKKKQTGTVISNCSFESNINWDKDAVKAICQIAKGLTENARSLGKVADIIRSQNITLGPRL